MCPSTCIATKELWRWLARHIVFMTIFILDKSCFCERWAFCVSCISYDHLGAICSSLVTAINCSKVNVPITRKAQCFHDCINITPICFCANWALYATYELPCLAFWALFGSLLPALCYYISYGQVHELPHSYCSDNWRDTLPSLLHIC